MRSARIFPAQTPPLIGPSIQLGVRSQLIAVGTVDGIHRPSSHNSNYCAFLCLFVAILTAGNLLPLPVVVARNDQPAFELRHHLFVRLSQSVLKLRRRILRPIARQRDFDSLLGTETDEDSEVVNRLDSKFVPVG
jgi:hypothetical protein